MLVTARPPRPRLTRGLAMLLAAAMVMASLSRPAGATEGSSRQVASVRYDTRAGDFRVLLEFDSVPPEPVVVGDGATRLVIQLPTVSRAPPVAPPLPPGGLVRSVEFARDSSGLTLIVTTTAPAHVESALLPGHTLAIAIAPARINPAAADAPAGVLPTQPRREPGSDEFLVVPLRYADVSEVVGLLTEGQTIKQSDRFTPQEPAFGSAGMMGAGAPPQVAYGGANNGAADPLAPLGQMVTDAVGVDRRLNAVILRGSPEIVAELRARIAAIDIPLRSVILETVFVELTENGARAVGVELSGSDSKLATFIYRTGPYAPFTGEEGGGSIQAAIYAQVQKGEGRIISRPRIAAQSGGTAKIVTGDALPILTSITLSGVNGVSQQVQYVNVGVSLQIAPRVTDDGFVTAQVFAVVSSVTGYSQGYPTISQRQASTSATVQDGESFIVGGLTQENDLSSTTKLPGLGDVPAIGALFRLRKGTRTKTELYIVITPRIVCPGCQNPPS